MQKNAPLTSYSPTAKRPWLWLVLIGFLWLQFAGVVHKHSHTDFQLASSQLEKILPDHSSQNKSDCQLFDLQCSGLALGFIAPIVVTLDLHTAFERLRFLSLAPLPSQEYQARAPPKF